MNIPCRERITCPPDGLTKGFSSENPEADAPIIPVHVHGQLLPSTPETVYLSQTQPPLGYLGVAYSFAFLVIYGVGPFTFTVASGTLPTGLSLAPGTDGRSTVLSGTPTLTGYFSFTLRISSRMSPDILASYTIEITRSGTYPANLPGIALWLDAADLDTFDPMLPGYVKTAPFPVMSWKDKSGNALIFDQPDTDVAHGLMPFYIPNTLMTGTGKPGVNFSRYTTLVSPFLQMLAAVPAPRPFSAFAIAQHSPGLTLSSTQIPVLAGETFVISSYRLFLFGKTGGTGLEIGCGYGAPFSWTADAYQYNIPTLVSQTHDVPINDPKIYVNGVQQTIVIQGTDDGYDLSQATSSYLGSWGAPLGRPFSGCISEVILATGILNDYDRQKVEQYLIAKWGIV